MSTFPHLTAAENTGVGQIDAMNDAVRIRAAGSTDDRVLELAAIESLLVNGRGGANAAIIALNALSTTASIHVAPAGAVRA